MVQCNGNRHINALKICTLSKLNRINLFQWSTLASDWQFTWRESSVTTSYKSTFPASWLCHCHGCPSGWASTPFQPEFPSVCWRFWPWRHRARARVRHYHVFHTSRPSMYGCPSASRLSSWCWLSLPTSTFWCMREGRGKTELGRRHRKLSRWKTEQRKV